MTEENHDPLKTGVIIARFQVPYLHDGHIYLINYVRERSDQIVILLGGPSTPDERNILPFDIRAQMIKDRYPKEMRRIYIHQLLDHREQNEAWSMNVDNILYSYPDITLYGSRDCFIKHYKGEHKFHEVPELKGFSGTKLREEMQPKNNTSYRMGLIHGFQLASQKTII